MGCSDSKVEEMSSRKQQLPLVPYNREAPLTLTIEDLRLQRFLVQVTLGTSVKDLYAQVRKLRGECSLYYAGEWLSDLSIERLGDYGMSGQAKIDILDRA